MKVKIIDEEHEKDLEDEINEFIVDKEIYDIKYSTSVAISGEDQIYCYSALIVYKGWWIYIYFTWILCYSNLHKFYSCQMAGGVYNYYRW